MEVGRKPYQGVLNIIRFNWHFYLLAIFFFVSITVITRFMGDQLQWIAIVGGCVLLITIFISLAISHYNYDRSNFYQLEWLDTNLGEISILNVNAGFDETSEIVLRRFPKANLTVCDFYDPQKHTEVSIKRARRAYPPYPNTISVETDLLPFEGDSFDIILGIFSIHEIRNELERENFIAELKRVLKPEGKLYITEHLRDFNNFLAYTFGFFHFHSKKNWKSRFRNADLKLSEEINSTPFIKTFVLKPNGNTS